MDLNQSKKDSKDPPTAIASQGLSYASLITKFNIA